MKSLALYIDKWYIVGAVCSGSAIRPISLPNNEDRIWLFFHEDIDSDSISYGKGYKSHFWNHENHYYGDVFSLITDPDATFIMFKRRQRFKDIFKSSKILDDLRAAMEVEGEIRTYLSFSKDISLGARMLFMEQLKSAGFMIEESAARIEHLALEYATKHSGLADDGYYLTLNACNENLHYAIYQKSRNLFVRKNDSVMCGMGTDLRGRCLVEYIIDNINKTERFLKGREEAEREYQRSMQYADDWIVRLAAARPHIPIQITGITLSIDPYKTYQVQVRKGLIDEKTASIVKNVADCIASFVAKAGVRQEQLRGILFLGNTLTNQQFSGQLLNHYNIPSERIVRYMDKDMPSLVSAYNFIDCSQFKDLDIKIADDAEAELLRIKNLKAEADAKKRAEEEAAVIAKNKRESEERERKYKEAIENGYRCEQERDYDNMAFYFEKALEFRTNDADAKQKYNDALRLKAEISVQMNTYKERIKQAKAAFEEKNWETARQKADEALSAYPDSKEATRIKEESARLIKQSKDFDRCIDRADIFIAQKLYDEATEELKKAKLIGLNDNAVKEREIKIRNGQIEIKESIEKAMSEMSQLLETEQYEGAILCCGKLLELDHDNKKKWTSRIADIKALQERSIEEKRRIDQLSNDIDAAKWAEDWSSLENLCREYLRLRHDTKIEDLLRRVHGKLAEESELKAVRQDIAEINDLIVHEEFKRANQKLRDLDKKDLAPDARRQIRELRKILFEREAEAEAKRKASISPRSFDEESSSTSSTKKESSHRPVVGFHCPPQQADDFFEDPSPRHSPKKSVKPHKKKASDDFFDTNPPAAKTKKDIIDSKRRITSEDFNF